MPKVRKIRLVDEAEIELWNQVIYYEKQESGLGLDFEKEVRIALKFIQENPSLRLLDPAENRVTPDGTERRNERPFLIRYWETQFRFH